MENILPPQGVIPVEPPTTNLIQGPTNGSGEYYGFDWGDPGYSPYYNADCYFADSFLDPQPYTDPVITATNPEPFPTAQPENNPIQIVVVYGHKEIPSIDNLPAVVVPNSYLDWMQSVVDGKTGSLCDNGNPGNKIDWGFISAHEDGPYPTVMTVPNQNGTVIDDSGPTIAGGFDLGHRTVDGLKALNLSNGLIISLTPYLGHHGQEAVTFVQSHPLTITSTQVNQINSAIHSATLARAVTTFDNAVGKTGAFYSLPAGVQTALADFAFNFNTLDRFPVFWSQITHSDWDGAINNLKTWGGSAPGLVKRRNDEANLLQLALNDGSIVDGVLC